MQSTEMFGIVWYALRTSSDSLRKQLTLSYES